MCGIAGFWTPGGLPADGARWLRGMTDAIRHRGPDDDGHWFDADAGVALGHRRLSIIDLSEAGHQPMISADGRWVIVFNGEIYNFRDIRAELGAAGVSFRGQSDTEAFLESVARWGLTAALHRAAGMFAFGLWDREQQVLHLARDRFGEKPLYYGSLNGAILFGSELKALRAYPRCRMEIDREALTLFFRFGYIPAPHTIFRRVHKLLPAHVASISRDGAVRVEPYWSLADVVERGIAEPLRCGDGEMVSMVEDRLAATIREQMISDVPLGALLSGGIDSSLVVALMQASSAQRVKTFTIGFQEPGYNEAEHAKAVAGHLGTDHTELYVTPAEAMSVIPLLPTIYDEPFADSSQIPTFLVSQLARRHVTVALSGDGGDEMFGGYNRYFIGRRLWAGIAPFPRAARRAAASAIRLVSPAAWGRAIDSGQRLLPRRYRIAHAGDRIHKLASVIDVDSPMAMYRALVSQWREPAAVVIDGHEPLSLLDDVVQDLSVGSDVERMMYADARTYLADDIMVKVDRATMCVSLESRTPFLDHRVAELAWRLPLGAKLRDGQGKWTLRQVLYRHVPRKLVERPKMGFGVPLDVWLRGPLREWAGDLLAPERLARTGYLRPDVIARTWREHLSGERNWQYLLWSALMFEAWLEVEPAGERSTTRALTA